MGSLLRKAPTVPALIIGVASVLLLLDDLLPDSATFDSDFVAAVLCFAIGATAVEALLADWIEPRRMATIARHGLKALVVSTISLAVSLVAAEYMARWFYRDITTTGDDHGYFTRQWNNSGAVTQNSRGFREREFEERKAPGLFRIAVVGDSFTYGNGLDAEHRFSNLMQRELPANMQVLNFGVPGHNTPDHVDTIRKNVLRLAPEFILVQWFVNDVEGAETASRPVYTPLSPFPALHAQLYRSSALYTLLNMRWTSWQAWSAGTYEDYMKKRFGDENGESARKDRQAMLDLVSLCRKAGVKVGFVLFPDSGLDLGPGYSFEFLHEREMTFCANEQVECLDLREAFSMVPDRRRLWVNRLDHHPSAEANEIAALEILKMFEAGWVSHPPRS